MVTSENYIKVPMQEKIEIIEGKKVESKAKKDQVNRLLKRIIDITGGITGCILLIPITCVIAICNILNKDKGPIFFIQERIGENGKLFKMLKYRTMVTNAEEILMKCINENEETKEEYQKYKKLKNDPRITKIGKWLRKTSLDEFPQFINVLKGEMSLVGPRPYLVREKEEMKQYYETIIQCKPGITGLWQVTGRSDVSFKNRLRLDKKYNEKKSMLLDIKIIMQTLVTLTKRKGAR